MRLAKVLIVLTGIAVLAAACGGGDEATTARPPPTVAAPPPATPPTAAAPTPTPTPAAGSATPIVVAGGKKGGILQTTIQSGYILNSDSYNSRAGASTYGLLLNNLIWQDPYGDGKVIVGDTAEGWTFGEGGKTLTFALRKGIKYHDSRPFTSRDVAYNIQRSWKPTTPRMVEFRGKFDAVQSIETPDDFTVRLVLSRPSNFLLTVMAFSGFLMYPAHIPSPEMETQWRDAPVGTGPFKHRATLKETRIEAVRNDAYWKPGLPHLDGVNLNAINDAALIISGYRTGKLDATTLDFTPLQPSIIDATLQKEQGFVPRKAHSAVGLIFNQKGPLTQPKVREAIDLAINRQDMVALGYSGLGNAFASPMLPPELGGLWGISTEVMGKRPGYRVEKAQDVARGKQLLAEAGIDPSRTTIRTLVTSQLTSTGEVVDSSIRSLGLRSELIIKATGPATEATQAGDFDVVAEALSAQADDPLDFLAAYTTANGGRNYGKWSNPEIDRLVDEQDRTLDPGKRLALLADLQEKVMSDRFFTMLLWRWVFVGGNSYVKNYPTANLPFIFGSRFRWEQVWLDKG